MYALLAPLERFLAFSARQGSRLLAAGIVAGLLIPPLSDAFYPTVAANVMLNTTLIILRIDFRAGLAHLRRPGRLALMLAWMLLGAPLLARLVVGALPLDPGIAAGAVASMTGCGVISGAALARLGGLDAELTLVLTMITTLILPLTAPPIALGLAGVDLSLTLSAMASRLAVVIGIPVLAAVVLFVVLGRRRIRAHATSLDGAIIWLIALYGVAVMHGVGARFLADPRWIVEALAVVYATSFGFNLLGALLFSWMGARQALAFGLLAGNRNNALYLAVLPATANPGIAMYFGITQFALNFTPMLLMPLYRRLVPRPDGARDGGARPGCGRSRRPDRGG